MRQCEQTLDGEQTHTRLATRTNKNKSIYKTQNLVHRDYTKHNRRHARALLKLFLTLNTFPLILPCAWRLKIKTQPS